MPVLINKESGLAENTPQTPETLDTHAIPLTDPEGHSVSVSSEEAAQLVHQGYRQPTPEELSKLVEHAKYNSTEQQLKTAGEGVAEGVLGPLAPLAGKALGVDAKETSKREEYNPGTKTASKALGLVGSAVGGIGEGAMLMDAGRAVEHLVGSVAGKSLVGKMGAGTARGVVENALYSSGDEVSKMIKNDPHQSVQSALADIGLSAALGGATGGAFGAGGAAWDALMEGKAGTYAKGLKDTLNKYTKPEAVVAEEAPVATIRNFPDRTGLRKYVAGIGEPEAEIVPEVVKAKTNLANSDSPDHVFDPFKKKFVPRSVPKVDATAAAEGAEFGESYIKRAVTDYMKENSGAAIGTKLGALVGHPLPGYLMGKHMLQPILDSVMPAITQAIQDNPASGAGLKSAINFGKSVLRGESKLNDAAQAIFTGTKIKTGADASDVLHKQLAEIQDKPEHLIDVGQDVGHYMPDHAQALGENVSRATSYLQSLQPSTSPTGSLNPPRQPNSTEIAKYKNALHIAQDPVTIFAKMQKGTLTQDDLKHMGAMYPELMQNMRDKLMNQMVTHMNDGKSIPYKSRLMLSMFLGTTLDSSMTPQAITAAQPIPQEQQPRQPHKVEKLGKSNSNGFSPMQASVARHLKV